jgi:hypothetical protein
MSLVGCVTFFSLLYVWQQTEVFRLAYDSQKNFSRFQELLDENSLLRYNLKKNTSLVKLAGKNSVSRDFQMPDEYCLVKIPGAKEYPASANRHLAKRQNPIIRALGINRQAEAKTLNPPGSLRVNGK